MTTDVQTLETFWTMVRTLEGCTVADRNAIIAGINNHFVNGGQQAVAAGAGAGAHAGQWLSASEAAKLIGIKRQTIYQLLNRGTLTAKKVNGEKCIARPALEAYMAQRQSTANGQVMRS